MIDTHHRWNVSFKPVILGFVFSLITIVSIYSMAIHTHLTRNWFTAVVGSLGCLQVIFQFIFFFHIGLESKPRWQFFLLLFTIAITLIVVIGTFWIMGHLDYNLMNM